MAKRRAKARKKLARKKTRNKPVTKAKKRRAKKVVKRKAARKKRPKKAVRRKAARKKVKKAKRRVARKPARKKVAKKKAARKKVVKRRPAKKAGKKVAKKKVTSKKAAPKRKARAISKLEAVIAPPPLVEPFVPPPAIPLSVDERPLAAESEPGLEGEGEEETRERDERGPSLFAPEPDTIDVGEIAAEERLGGFGDEDEREEPDEDVPLA